MKNKKDVDLVIEELINNKNFLKYIKSIKKKFIKNLSRFIELDKK